MNVKPIHRYLLVGPLAGLVSGLLLSVVLIAQAIGWELLGFSAVIEEDRPGRILFYLGELPFVAVFGVIIGVGVGAILGPPTAYLVRRSPLRPLLVGGFIGEAIGAVAACLFTYPDNEHLVPLLGLAGFVAGVAVAHVRASRARRLHSA